MLPKSDWDEDLAPATVREIEADFFALVALVPDYVLWRLKQEDRLNARSVVRYLCSHEHRDKNCDCNSLEGLAQYRINLFLKFAHLFRAASLDPFERSDGRPFRNVATIDGVDPENLRQLTKADENEDIQQILMFHPRVERDPFLKNMLKEVGLLPFSPATCVFPAVGATGPSELLRNQQA